MRILVTGDRNWTDQRMVDVFLYGLYEDLSMQWYVSSLDPMIVIEGGAKGADECAANWCNMWGPKHKALTMDEWENWEATKENMGMMPNVHIQVPAKWDEYGKKAGILRNIEMLDMKPDVVIGFHNDIQNSKGTKHCLEEAKRRGIKCFLIKEL